MTNPIQHAIAKIIGDAIFGSVDPVDTPNTWGQSMTAAQNVLAEIVVNAAKAQTPAPAPHFKGTININDRVRVRLTKTGRTILAEQAASLRREFPKLPAYVAPSVDADGYSSFQLWSLINSFGSNLVLSNHDLPFETEILVTLEGQAPAPQVTGDGISCLYSEETPQGGAILIAKWPEGYVLWYHGHIVWRSWAAEGQNDG